MDYETVEIKYRDNESKGIGIPAGVWVARRLSNGEVFSYGTFEGLKQKAVARRYNYIVYRKDNKLGGYIADEVFDCTKGVLGKDWHKV